MVKDLQRQFEYYKESMPWQHGITIFYHSIRDKETGENICRMHDEEAARLMAQAPELLRDAMAFRKLKSLAIQSRTGDVEIGVTAGDDEFPWAIIVGSIGGVPEHHSLGKTIHEALEGLPE